MTFHFSKVHTAKEEKESAIPLLLASRMECGGKAKEERWEKGIRDRMAFTKRKERKNRYTFRQLLLSKPQDPSSTGNRNRKTYLSSRTANNLILGRIKSSSPSALDWNDIHASEKSELHGLLSADRKKPSTVVDMICAAALLYIDSDKKNETKDALSLIQNRMWECTIATSDTKFPRRPKSLQRSIIGIQPFCVPGSTERFVSAVRRTTNMARHTPHSSPAQLKRFSL
ncbi:uncharacterized [Tachysurus ichikawai]